MLTNSMPRPASSRIADDRGMLAGAAGLDLQVLERHAAERHDEARMGGDLSQVVPGPRIALSSPSTCGVITEPAALE